MSSEMNPPSNAEQKEPSLAFVALAFIFCMPYGLLLALAHSAFRKGNKVDPLFIGALVLVGLSILYMVGSELVEHARRPSLNPGP
jgi:hypothetical protein